MTDRLHILVLPLLAALACTPGVAEDTGQRHVETAVAAAPVDSSFARLIARLSEPGGYFDTDNLISNETSYLHVLPKLRELGVRGGVYLGVGPAQNFSYIAAIRPRMAFIVDIRRDNMLQHLLFKAIFSLSYNRAEYLSLLLGRRSPRDLRKWNGKSIEQLIVYYDNAPSSPELRSAVWNRLFNRIVVFGVPLSRDDIDKIRKIHSSFVTAGLNLRFTSFNRPPRNYYPTLRQLMLETDLNGMHGSFLATENSFQFVKQMEDQDRVIPVVGDLAGPHAIKAIGKLVREGNETVTAFYTSNVEFYLWGNGVFEQFMRNIKSLPVNENSVVIRSYFGNFRFGRHPHAVPGYYSAQLLQSLQQMINDYDAGGIASYWDLVTLNSIPLR